jgi:hypothetical protein
MSSDGNVKDGPYPCERRLSSVETGLVDSLNAQAFKTVLQDIPGLGARGYALRKALGKPVKKRTRTSYKPDQYLFLLVIIFITGTQARKLFCGQLKGKDAEDTNAVDEALIDCGVRIADRQVILAEYTHYLEKLGRSELPYAFGDMMSLKARYRTDDEYEPDTDDQAIGSRSADLSED